MTHDPAPAPGTPAVSTPKPVSKTTLPPAYPLALAASLLVAPLFCGFLLRDEHDALAGELKAALMLIGIAALVLPAVYTVVLLLLARRRDALARGFLPLVLACLVALAALMMAQGVVLVLTACELGSHLELVLTLSIGIAGLALIGAGILALPGVLACGTAPPLECTGVVVTDELPLLRARVRRVAELLGVAVPPRIIVGLEPRCFAAAAPLALRGGDPWPAAETIYLPLLALRVLTGAELDALIGHELAHLRGGDVSFAQRFVPDIHARRLGRWVCSQLAKGVRALISFPRIAIVCMVLFAGLLSTGISQQRELAADRAAAEAANPPAVIAAIFKISVLMAAWQAWPRLEPDPPARRLMPAYGPAPQRHSNLVERQLDIAQLLLDRYCPTGNPEAVRAWLFEASRAHPLDSHPTHSQRAAALGVDMAAVLDGVLRDIHHPAETERCAYLEQEITFLELKFGRAGEGEDRGGPPRAVVSS